MTNFTISTILVIIAAVNCFISIIFVGKNRPRIMETTAFIAICVIMGVILNLMGIFG
jgi:hypothetical protein